MARYKGCRKPFNFINHVVMFLRTLLPFISVRKIGKFGQARNFGPYKQVLCMYFISTIFYFSLEFNTWQHGMGTTKTSNYIFSTSIRKVCFLYG